MSAIHLTVETLEERRVLAALTIITHGGQSSDGEAGVPRWVMDMATAINDRLGKPCQPDQISDSRASRQAAASSGNFTAPSTACQKFLLYDWSDVNDQLGVADADNVAGVLAELVRHRLPSSGKLNLHFIGHSRGVFVNRAAVAQLNTAMDDRNTGFLYMTNLDPQPFGDDGPLTRPANVDWLDNYFQTLGLDEAPDFNGEPVLGANANIDLTDVLRRWNGRPFFTHGEVHDWYHWTIDGDDATTTPYADPALARQQDELHAEYIARRRTTRDLLYERSSGFDLDGDGSAEAWGWGRAEPVHTGDAVPQGVYDLVHTITTAEPSSHDFGQSLAISGGSIFISDPRSSTFPFLPDELSGGVVYQFDRTSGKLVRLMRAPNPGGDPFGGFSEFGKVLAAWENRVLIGASTASIFAAGGRAFLYDTNTGRQLRTFESPARQAFSPARQFGAALAVRGNDVLIGDPSGDFPGLGGVGAAYLFDASTGALRDTFFSPTPAFEFGKSVAIAGAHIFVAEPYRDTTFFNRSGQVHVFRSDTLAYVRTIVSPEVNVADGFAGQVVAMGDDILITATGSGVFGGGGAVYLFDGDTGALVRTFKHPERNRDQGFGTTVSAAGDRYLLVTGSTGQFFQGEQVVFLFDAANGRLVHTFRRPPGTKERWHFGRALGGDGQSILISDPGRASVFGLASSSSGVVYHFLGPSPAPPGDSNRDGIFDSSDLIVVFQAGKYEDGVPNNATLEQGDWDGDGDFTTADLVFAFQAGNYVAAAQQATDTALIASALHLAPRESYKGGHGGRHNSVPADTEGLREPLQPIAVDLLDSVFVNARYADSATFATAVREWDGAALGLAEGLSEVCAPSLYSVHDNRGNIGIVAIAFCV